MSARQHVDNQHLTALGRSQDQRISRYNRSFGSPDFGEWQQGSNNRNPAGKSHFRLVVTALFDWQACEPKDRMGQFVDGEQPSQPFVTKRMPFDS